MKRLLMALAAGALLIGGAGAANAQPRPYQHFDGPDWGRDHHDWRRGGRVDRDEWRRGQVVTDWRVRHLRRPPRGYEWREVNGDYVLAAVATGIIADLLLNNR